MVTRKPSNSVSQHARHGVWVPACAGTTMRLFISRRAFARSDLSTPGLSSVAGSRPVGSMRPMSGPHDGGQPASRRNRLCRLDLVAQHELLDLSGRSLWYRTEHHGLRRLEARHLRAAKPNDLGFGRAGVVLQFDERAGHLAPL